MPLEYEIYVVRATDKRAPVPRMSVEGSTEGAIMELVRTW